jgi:hypothetical protein
MAEFDILHVPEVLSRDGSLDKDSFVRNGFYEKNPEGEVLVGRPGYAKFAQITTNTNQLPYGLCAYKDGAGNERLMAINGTALLVTAGAASTPGSTTLGTFNTSYYPQAVLKGSVDNEVIEFFVNTSATYGTYTALSGRVPLGRVSTNGGTSFTTFACPQSTETGVNLTEMWATNNGGSYGNGAWAKHRDYLYYSGGFGNAQLYRSADKGRSWAVVNSAAGFENQNYNGQLISDGRNSLMHIRYIGSSTLFYPRISTNDGTTWSTAGTVAFGGGNSDLAPTPVYFNNRWWYYGPGTATDSIHRAFGSPDGATWTNYGTAQLNTSAGTGLSYVRNVVVSGAIYSFGGITSTSGTYTNLARAAVSYNGARFYQLSTAIGFSGAHVCNISYAPSVANIAGDTFYISGVSTGSTGLGLIAANLNTQYILTFSGTAALSTDATNLDPGTYDFAQNYARTRLYLKNAYKLYDYDTALGTMTQVTDAQYPAYTVRGMPMLDDYAFVMDSDGNIYNSAEGDFASWDGSFIAAQFENDGGVALSKSGGNLVALGEYTIEQFYNAGNAVGSPLLPVQTTPSAVGCAAADTLQVLQDTIYFVGQEKTNGQGRLPQRSIYSFVGNSAMKLSNPDIDRLLARSTLVGADATIMKVMGHTLYVVRLPDLGFSLAYDVQTSRFSILSATDQATTYTPTSVTGANGTATYLGTTTVLDGDPIVVSGYTSTNTIYNGTFAAIVPGTNTVCWTMTGSLAATNTNTGTLTHQYARALPFVNAVGFQGTQILQHADDGYIYYFEESTFADNGTLPIDFRMRTTRVDAGTAKSKFWAYLEVMTDKVDGDMMMRHSDDDATSWSRFNRRSMDTERVRFNRLGAGAARQFELRILSPVRRRIRRMKPEAVGGNV